MPITLQTNLTPDIVLYDERGTVPDPLTDTLMSFLKPRVSGTLPLVGFIEYAPQGAPTPGLGTIILGILALFVVFGIIAVVQYLQRRS